MDILYIMAKQQEESKLRTGRMMILFFDLGGQGGFRLVYPCRKNDCHDADRLFSIEPFPGWYMHMPCGLTGRRGCYLPFVVLRACDTTVIIGFLGRIPVEYICSNSSDGDPVVRILPLEPDKRWDYTGDQEREMNGRVDGIRNPGNGNWIFERAKG